MLALQCVICHVGHILSAYWQLTDQHLSHWATVPSSTKQGFAKLSKDSWYCFRLQYLQGQTPEMISPMSTTWTILARRRVERVSLGR